jgi:tagatose-1,6-bisphosphate aldolase
MTLADFQTPDGFFAIAPFDHRSSLAQSLKLDLKKPEHAALFLRLKHLFMKILSPHVSAVLTDPEYGIQTIGDKADTAGLFLSIEESGYSGDHEAMTSLKPNWGIDGVKAHGAGAKLLLYYNPAAPNAKDKVALVSQLFDEAKSKEVIFLVEPVLYATSGKKLWGEEWDPLWIQTHLEVCETFAPLCDILKVQYPGSPEACAAVTRMHPNWLLLSRGVDYGQFLVFLKTALAQGCRGFAAGRAIWRELTMLPSEEWEKFLQTTAVDRLEELKAQFPGGH